MSTSAASFRDRVKTSSLRKWLRSSAWYWRIKLLLKRLTGKEIWIRRDIRLAAAGSGDYRYDASALNDASVIYSFGVGDSIAFESELIESCDAEVHTFDPTPYTLKWIETIEVPERLKFYPWAVAGRDGELELYPRLKGHGQRSDVMWTMDSEQADKDRVVRVPAYSIPSLMRKLGHKTIDLIKMDVEGAEYDALSSVLKTNVRPKQMLVEFHHRFSGIGQRRTIDLLRDLRAADYRVFWVAPTGREVCLIHDS